MHKFFDQKEPSEPKLCECGCGQQVKSGNRFIAGHHHRCRSEETRRRHSEALKGKKANLSEEGRRRLSELASARAGENHPMRGKKHSEETKRKYSEDRKGKKKPPHVSQLISERNKRLWQDPEYRARQLECLRNANLGRKASQETKNKMSVAQMGEKNHRWGTVLDDETKQKISNGRKKFWETTDQKDILIEQFIKNQNRVINNAEKKLLRDLNKLYPQQWVFVGDGSMIVNGKNPDFYNADKNLLIELFGDYWHQNDDPQERINLFREKGYNTLVLWEHELKNKTALRETIIDFVESH